MKEFLAVSFVIVFVLHVAPLIKNYIECRIQFYNQTRLKEEAGTEQNRTNKISLTIKK